MSGILGCLTYPSAGGSFDSDAQAFFTAAGITDATQKSAVNQLVLDLKAASIWTKFNAIYPFVGGDATKHSYNLKAPASFQITWSGTVTHDANGMTGNGSTGFGDTGLNASTSLTLNDVHLSVYSRSAPNNGAGDIGCFANTSQYFAIYCKFSDNKMYGELWQSTAGELISTATVASGQGLFTATRRGATDAEIYRNGSSVATKTTTQTGTRPNVTVAVGGVKGASEFSAKNIAFASIGTGLTGTDVSNLYTAVQAFQTTLSRQV